MHSNLPKLDILDFFKPPLDGTIIIQDLQRFLKHRLGIYTDIPPELTGTASQPLPESKFHRSLRILSEPLVTEKVTFSDEIDLAGDKVHRLMGILHFDVHYAQGFMLEVYGTDIFKAMNKKIRKMQDLFDGFGAPPFEPSQVHDVAARFVAENIDQ